MPFDISGALGAGYTPDAIVAYLQQNPKAVPNFDVAGALGSVRARGGNWEPVRV